MGTTNEHNLTLPVDMNWLMRNAASVCRYGYNESVEIPIPNAKGHGKFYLKLYRMDRKDKSRRVDLVHYCSQYGVAWVYLGEVRSRQELITLSALYEVEWKL